MDYTVETLQSAAQPLVVVRRCATLAELPKVIPDACGEVWRFIKSRGIVGAGRHVTVYFDRVMNLECGAEVPADCVGKIAEEGGVYFSAVPAGLVAHTTHWGDYRLLKNAHAAIQNWCSANNFTPTGPTWEVYGHWNDDPAKVVTDIYYLLK